MDENTNVKNEEQIEEINKEIYKRNFELAVVNKTLSLLKKLYQISLFEIAPQVLSEQLSQVIVHDLKMEMVGILSYDDKKDILVPLHFSYSDRCKEAFSVQNISLQNLPILNCTENKILNEVILARVSTSIDSMVDIWGNNITQEVYTRLTQMCHIKTITLYPLVTSNKVLGVLLMGLNRPHSEVSEREQETMDSLIDVVAVSLDKAYLYEELANANEKLKSLDALKTEFLSLASHQLRSPLTAIKGYASMVLEGDFGEINPQAKDAVERVFQSTMNLTKVVEDLLDVSKIEQGGMKYEMAPFNLCDISSDMTKDLSIVAEKKGLHLVFESGSASECMVNGDKEKVRQVVLNFIDNSIKYTKEGSITVAVHKINNKITFTVKDTGMGMTPEIKATLFQKFSRGDGARMNTGGSGLGLYLAKEIIEAHKGKVDVLSEGLGKGSTFLFEMDALQ